MTPTINVNLTKCGCASEPDPSLRHAAGRYPAAPILIPCPVPPTVEFTVTLGECNCPVRALPGSDVPHRDYCSASPIRVICSISGTTWGESAVVGIENAERRDGLFAGINPERVLSACRERWVLVTALVLDTRTTGYRIPSHWRPLTERIFLQRDAVFAALADMARLEIGAMQAQQRVDEAFPSSRFAKPGDADHRALGPSVNRLARFFSHLIEQVAALP